MATRTTTTRTTSFASAPSADPTVAPYPFRDLVQAYYDCRRTKRNSASALAFEMDLERNLINLHEDLVAGSYRPGRSICFVVTRPKAREVWAAAFRDRIVHHLLYNHIGASIEAKFIADSCACIPERGTLYAAERLEAKVRSVTRNWRRPAHYLKMDLANFFVAIDKRVLTNQLVRLIDEPWWRRLALQVLWHDPRVDYEVRSRRGLFNKVPQHKRLTAQTAHLGLPIGNLSSQFFANIYLNDLDQFVKHQLRAKHYIRYVDDFLLLHESPQQLNEWLAAIEAFLPGLGARLNPSKTILQPVDRGIDFVGHVIKPWRRTTRKRTVKEAMRRVAAAPADDLLEVANSYFGLFRQASHSQVDRAALANVLLRRGRSINGALTKTYRKPTKEPAA
ncbi:reverse transcriptase [Pseudomonas aeruginosa]|uniref:RNA-directed DNA polymerase n=1 Tax=Pseudomonas aeruginosa TaxID=287 RepID=UPI001909CD72|nr:RNA-directed DNA polymerase [Pseudomonas aeruginosa]MBK3752739.1 reverse transcriptase [Pseudomonas aeruginosa]MBK3762977.1 reverse transcriptase [Pseudomonas aeruginosa]MBK3769517.1 reverse transcriptase [Pseudomonas aeruginosa]MBK3789705.1 reverse transcriptase [Pseudomonas aeruginosa]MBK3885751.1 reverse transcriptase [Pseudomonas aeruginosa]